MNKLTSSDVTFPIKIYMMSGVAPKQQVIEILQEKCEMEMKNNCGYLLRIDHIALECHINIDHIYCEKCGSKMIQSEVFRDRKICSNNICNEK